MSHHLTNPNLYLHTFWFFLLRSSFALIIITPFGCCVFIRTCIFTLSSQFMSPAHPGLSLAELQTAAVIVQGVSHQVHSVCVYCVCKVCVSVCSCPVPRWWILIDVRCLLCVSQLPSARIPAQGFMKPGGWSQPNYVGGAQLDCTPIHLPHSTQAAKKERGSFSSFHHCKCWVLSGPQITWKDRVEVFVQAAGLEPDIRPAGQTFSQRAIALLAARQQTMLIEGLQEPNGRPHEHFQYIPSSHEKQQHYSFQQGPQNDIWYATMPNEESGVDGWVEKHHTCSTCFSAVC